MEHLSEDSVDKINSQDGPKQMTFNFLVPKLTNKQKHGYLSKVSWRQEQIYIPKGNYKDFPKRQFIQPITVTQHVCPEAQRKAPVTCFKRCNISI